jgi:CheY-like chemotaxis protein
MIDYDVSELRILIVDDCEPMRMLMRSVLRAMGVRSCAEAEDGTEALKLFEKFSPDIVFIDHFMEPMDGVELTRKIRAGEEGIDPYIPIIMVSGFSDLKRIMAARDVGVSEYLVKPISAKLLYLRICAVIEHPRPFIRTSGFFGPDRRRRPVDHGEEERRDSKHDYDHPTRDGKR